MISVGKLTAAAFRSIMRNRMRSLLTSLGIIIGVAAVIVMVAVGEGSQAKIESDINALGTNLLIVFPGSATSGGARMGAGSFNRFTFDDVDDIRRDATLLSGVSAVVRSGGQIIGGSSNWSTEIYGVDIDYFDIRNWQLESGAFFEQKDINGKRKVALLGKTVADELFPDQDPVGQTVRIRNIPFSVIGVLKEKGQSGMGADQDDVVLAPSTTVLYRLKGRQWVDMINASAASTEQVDAAIEEMREILRRSHKLEEGDDDDFSIRSQAEITEAVTSTTKTFTLLLGSIAAVSLIVGGIGIMNIMLVSVTERTREIGIRLSVGARESDILVQFLTEAVVLSITGGLTGILVSAAAVQILDYASDLNPIMTPEIMIISFLFSAAVGVFFGFYPARKAAALDPIDALRHE
ncbi:MAG TPA: ABC transporter permease [candidate division Zixibacteria bacterium]|nr:ABC transporter permease [candidate division Zixibacteria bacterium]